MIIYKQIDENRAEYDVPKYLTIESKGETIERILNTHNKGSSSMYYTISA